MICETTTERETRVHQCRRCGGRYHVMAGLDRLPSCPYCRGERLHQTNTAGESETLIIFDDRGDA